VAEAINTIAITTIVIPIPTENQRVFATIVLNEKQNIRL
jgi:hypothetical protein